jgi:hypothetical protein
MEMLDDRLVAREVKFFLDFTEIPPDDLPLLDAETMLVPLHRLNRHANANTQALVDNFGELGRPVAGVERSLVAAGLEARWRRKNSAFGADLTEIVSECISHPTSGAPKLADSLHISEPLSAKLQRADRAAQEAVLAGQDLKDYKRDLVRWQEEYLLLVELPTSLLNSNRIVVTLRYEQTLEDDRRIGIKQAFVALRRVLFGSLASMSFRIPVGRVVDAESGHVTLAAPPGFRVVGAALRIDYRTDDPDAPIPRWYRDRDRLPSEAHVVVDSQGRPIQSARFMASIYSFKIGFLTESLIASWLLVAIVQLFYNRASSSGFVPSNEHVDSNVAAAFILLMPAAVVTLITQRDGHRIAARCFALPRLLLAASAFASVSCAAMIALEVGGRVAQDGWFSCSLVAWSVAIRISIGYLVHWYRSSYLRYWLRTPIWVWEDYFGDQALSSLDRSRAKEVTAQ